MMQIPDPKLVLISKALSEKYLPEIVSETIPVIRDRANLYTSNLFSIVYREMRYGRQTHRNAFAQTLENIAAMGQRVNGASAQFVLEDLRNNFQPLCNDTDNLDNPIGKAAENMLKYYAEKSKKDHVIRRCKTFYQTAHGGSIMEIAIF